MIQHANLLPYSCSIPCRLQFLSQLLHFRSSSLLVAQENRGGRPKALGPYTHVEPQRVSWPRALHQLSMGLYDHLGCEPAGQMPAPSVSLSLPGET